MMLALSGCVGDTPILPKCPAGFLLCDDQCVDPSSSSEFCGAKSDCSGESRGTACSADQVCSGGACVAPRLQCPVGSAACDGTCVNPQTDSTFCGASPDCSSRGKVCGSDEVCMGGRCLGKLLVELCEGQQPDGCAVLASPPVGGPTSGLSDAKMSADGRFIVFVSNSANYADQVGASSNNRVYLRDLVKGTTTLVSAGWDGSDEDGTSGSISISADGRYVAFNSRATNLIKGNPTISDNSYRVYRYDRDASGPKIALVSVDKNGSAASGIQPRISADGLYVAFMSTAGNLTTRFTANGRWQIYRRDMNSTSPDTSTLLVSYGSRCVGTTEAWDAPGDADSVEPAISGDGNVVAYTSIATNLSGMNCSGGGAGVGWDANNATDIYLRDMAANSSQQISVTSTGGPTCGPGASCTSVSDTYTGNSGGAANPTLSYDGRYVAYSSWAEDIVPGDSNKARDVFWFDRIAHDVRRVSLGSNGNQAAQGMSSAHPAISADGRRVVFDSQGAFGGETDQKAHVFSRDVFLGTTLPVDGVTGADAVSPNLSSDGSMVSFVTTAPLLSIDTNSAADAYIKYLPRMKPQRLIEIVAEADATLSATSPDAPNGSGNLVVDSATSDALIRFDLSKIGLDGIVTSADLRMVSFDGSATVGDGNVYVNACTSNVWEEDKVTWSSASTFGCGSATWGDYGYWRQWYNADHNMRDIRQCLTSSARLKADVEAQRAGTEKKLTMRLHSLFAGYWTSYFSRESPVESYRPTLRVWVQADK